MEINSPFTPLKIIRHKELLESFSQGHLVPPVTVELDPTNACNHSCIWCMYKHFKQESPQSLPKNILISLISEFSEMGVKAIIFTGGGEPFMNKCTPEMIAFATKKAIEVAVVTNGELLTDDIITNVARNCTWTRISLDAASSQTHRRCHNSKETSFEIINTNISNLVAEKKLIRSPLTVGIGFLIHPINYTEVYDAVDNAAALGVDYIQFRPIYSFGFNLEPKIVESSQTQIERAREDFASDNFAVYSSLHRFQSRDRDYSTCFACRVVGVVAADMNTYICCQLKGDPRFSTGDLRHASFRDIWFHLDTHRICKAIDVSKCPPCRYDECNSVLNYLVIDEPKHINFL